MVWDWQSLGSVLATILFLRTAINDFIPIELREFLRFHFSRLHDFLRPTSIIIIDEQDPSGHTNELFEASQSYLGSRCLSSAAVLRLHKPRNSKTLKSSLPSSHSTTDYFEGGQLSWKFNSVEKPVASYNSIFSRSDSDERRFLELSFHRMYRDMVHSRYVPFILDEAARLKAKSRERKLYTNRAIGSSCGEAWSSVNFTHPSTFNTIAIDPSLCASIQSDLLRFSSRRDYYMRVGRAWKRGYLLHGPPGTGKTSLIAAIANFLEFDVYDLELTAVTSNSHLRKLLVSTTAKSVIVVEDVDCSLDLSDRKKFKNPNLNNYSEEDTEAPTKGAATPYSTVSLSGVLNFVDGLWSSCVGERLMIFTTNHPERLDPALLRPGRMDMKIELSYCGPAAFRVLAKNYLEMEGKFETMEVAEELLKKVKITPAEVAEIFMGCDGVGVDVVMEKVVEELNARSKTLPPIPLEDGCFGTRRTTGESVLDEV